MLDIYLLREKPDAVRDGLRKKGADPALADQFLRFDEEWRKLTKTVDDKRAILNRLSQERKIEEAKKVKEELKETEANLTAIERDRAAVLEKIPNLPFDDVPVGKDESGNRVLREVGKKPKFDFKPKDHLELGEALDIVDFQTASRVSGAGFYYLKNEGVLLELALIRYALDFLRKKGYTLWLTPDLAREKFYLGTGYLPRGPEAQTYEIKDSDLGLIATAEVTLAGIHAGEILEEKTLPRRYAGYSHCFRQEAGGYGKYSKGLYRVHQFSKVEMFAYAKPEDAPKIHEEILALEEALWRGLKIPYRVLEMCTGDLGAQAARKYDLEAWMPGRPPAGGWGEVTSASNTTDYQSRRLNIKYRPDTRHPEPVSRFVHTLNGTAIATSRAIVAILENCQTKQGTVKIPAALVKYAGIREIK